MSRFFERDHLRRIALPESAAASLHVREQERPVLVARWHRAPDGRLICRWQMADTAHRPPPH